MNTMYHTSNFVRQMVRRAPKGKRPRLSDNPLADKTIYILALPMVYGLMSLMSVIRCLEVSVNNIGAANAHLFKSFIGRKNFAQEMFESNFCVGDVYETLALRAFAQLVTMELENKIVGKMKDKDVEDIGGDEEEEEAKEN